MTIEEAIKTMEIAIAEVEWNYPMSYAVAFEKAIDVLKKQKPKKPITEWHLKEDVQIGSGTFKAGTCVLSKCPECSGWLRPKQQYCQDCGQAIEW